MRRRPDSGLRVAASMILALCCGLSSAAAVPEVEVEKVTRHVVCDCGCPPQSIHDCTCGHADNLTGQIRDEMGRDGLDGDAMLARWLDRHGETARLVPEAKGFSLVAWLAPVLAIPLFGFLIVRFLKRASTSPEASPAPSAPALATPERERLRQAFEEWDA